MLTGIDKEFRIRYKYVTCDKSTSAVFSLAGCLRLVITWINTRFRDQASWRYIRRTQSRQLQLRVGILSSCLSFGASESSALPQ